MRQPPNHSCYRSSGRDWNSSDIEDSIQFSEELRDVASRPSLDSFRQSKSDVENYSEDLHPRIAHARVSRPDRGFEPTVNLATARTS